ncbi:MAG: twitching motility protein PilT [Clostridiales bacterium]|nr:twitching motility protein PilT [Clostridiales bacterium]
MIQIIAGAKGKGKTKVLLEKVNNEVSSAKGSIVYLDKNNKHMYELSNKIRLINVKDYLIENHSEFLGFLCGIISCDHDLQSIYLDSFLTIAVVNDENINEVFEKLSLISNHFKINLCISISLNYDQIPDNMKENVIVSL